MKLQRKGSSDLDAIASVAGSAVGRVALARGVSRTFPSNEESPRGAGHVGSTPPSHLETIEAHGLQARCLVSCV